MTVPHERARAVAWGKEMLANIHEDDFPASVTRRCVRCNSSSLKAPFEKRAQESPRTPRQWLSHQPPPPR